MINLDKLSAGQDVPNNINVVIEIPMRSEPVKYEMDKESGMLVVDRFMATAMFYPGNYGYMPHTMSEDGDPVDVLVLTVVPLNSGVVIPSRPIGLLQMTDEAGVDCKILAVPVDDITVLYKDVKSYKDLPKHVLATIVHFFEHYKDLEQGKWVKVDGWQDVEAAHKEILASIKRAEQ